MNTPEGLDCWDDYPMEHGCICGNDCEPPSLPLDPEPWVLVPQVFLGETAPPPVRFDPRPGFSQNREAYR